MKRSTELTLFTLTVCILSIIALHGASKMRVSIDVMASDTAKTYLLNKGESSFPVIGSPKEELETDR